MTDDPHNAPGPRLAGDAGSFPSDAERSRTLAARTTIGTMATLTAEGHPFGSIVTLVIDDDGAPVVLVSEMAEHTINARRDPKASVLLADDRGDGDVLGRSRLTLVGELRELGDDDAATVRDRFLDTHPGANVYVDFPDFSFWRLEVSSVRWVGGFGQMGWVSADDYRAAEPDPVDVATPGIIEHMNDDHADANLAYVQHLAGLTDATSATLTEADRYGLTLWADTPAGARPARVAFPEPLTAPDQARPAVVALLQAARAAAE